MITPYDFDYMTERRHTYSAKWDVSSDELPMWIADMDFKTAPEITAAIMERAAEGIFGYNIVPDEWYQAIQEWWLHEHHFTIKKEWLIFCTGIVPAISTAVRKFTSAAEQVVVLTPGYNIFFNSILNNGRVVVESRLIYQGGGYNVDFSDLEKKLSDPQTTMMIFCNPHNPTGNLWSQETMARIGELCEAYHVLVIADEIHCDITMPGSEYVPFASVSDCCARNSISCIAPTKAFNLAGLQTAAVVIPDSMLYHRMNRALNTDEVAEPNTFAIQAAIVAFRQGGLWLKELRRYIWDNKERVSKFLRQEQIEITVCRSQATYLMWLDCSRLSDNTDELVDHLRKATGLYLSAGSIFGGDGKRFIRMNVACPRQRLYEGLTRLKEGLKEWKENSV